jgi:hypothetical protein
MRKLSDVRISDEALRVLRKEIEDTRLQPGNVIGLVYVKEYVNPNGATVKGFRPGYMAGPWEADQLSDTWAQTQLASGELIYFIPRWKWDAQDPVLIALVAPNSRMFTISSIRR